MRRKNRLKVLLVILVSIFIMFSAAALLLAGFQKSEREAQKKKEAMAALESLPTAAPTEVPVTPSPSPTPRPTATPTPIPKEKVSFNPDDFWDYWYSTDGLVTINIYNISQDSVSFSFSQTDAGQTQSVSADVTAEVAGTAAAFSFTDTAGNAASGNLTFDNGQLYLRATTAEPVSSVYPNVSCVMSRTQVQLQPDPTVTPTPAEQAQNTAETGEYFFPESSNRYLTDEEISAYSSDQLELAKNEIYARHGRQFVTDYIADYFTYPHNSHYPGNIKDHCHYENHLKHGLRAYIRSGEAVFGGAGYKRSFSTVDEMLEYIQEAHEEYMKQPGSVENDCKYITTVCSRVLASMPQFAEVPVMAYAG